MWESRQVRWSPSLGFFLLFPSPLPKSPTTKNSISSSPSAKHQRGPVINSCRWSWERATVVAGRPVYCHLLVVRESAAFSAGLQARSPEQEQLVLQPSLKAFREKFLKTGWGSAAVRCVISSWTFFWWVGSDVIGSQHHPTSGSNPSGLHCEQCRVNFLQLVGVSISSKRFTAVVLNLSGTRD